MILNASELNKCYYDVITELKGDKRFIVLWGGRNGSKSHSMMQAVCKEMWNGTHDTIFFRNLNAIIKRTAYDPMVKMLKDKGLFDDTSKNTNLCTGTFYSNNQYITFPNGNRLYFSGADNYEKIKGIANVKRVIIDEIDQIPMHTFMGINTSFRGIEDIKFVLLFNPVDAKHWLKRLFFDGTGKIANEGYYIRRSARYHYTIDDNKFATQDDHEALDALIETDLNKYNIERWGKWGTISVDNPFFDKFNYNINTREGVPFFGDYPLIVSWDFGGSDYAIAGQSFTDFFIENDISLREFFPYHNQSASTVIREYSQTSYSTSFKNAYASSISFIVEQIVEEFGIDTEYWITGDSAGGKIKYIDISDAFEQCGAYNIRFIARKKPTHEGSRTLGNWIFVRYKENYVIDRDCLTVISDISNVKVTDTGKIDDPDTIQRNIGHHFDCVRYKDYNLEYKNFAQRTGQSLGYRNQRVIHE